MRFEQEVNVFNPAALSRKFSAIQTDFDVTLGKISAIISDSDIEQYQDGHTTMNSKLSATIQDLDGFHTQVSEMQTSYDGQFASVDSRLTTFDETLDGISANVSSVSQSAIKGDQIHYLATSASSGVTISTPGWTTTPQRITSTNRYLWTYHTYTKGDNSTTNTTPVITGVWGDRGLQGDTGISISNVVNYYLATSLSSGVTTDTVGWTTAIQTMTATNQYLWTYEVIIGSDESIISSSDPIIIGRYGRDGENGEDGADGDDGRGITSITEFYAVSSSNTVVPASWSNTMVNTTPERRYLWNYERILYTDGTTEDTSKRVIGTHGEKGDSAASYEIRTSSDAIIRTKTGTASPTFVTFTCYRRIGEGDASTFPCYWVIEEYANGSWNTIETTTAMASVTRYVGNNATAIMASAYLSNTLSSTSLLDRQDVPVISEGSDGYTVMLTNSSHTFAGNETSALSTSIDVSVAAYKGSTRLTAVIGTITGQPTGMSASAIAGGQGTENARFRVTVDTSMTTKSGTLTVPVTTDEKTFNLIFSYSLALKGSTGANGINTATVYMYRLLTSTNTPASPVNSVTYTFSTKTLSGNPGNSWSTTIPSGSGTVWIAIATASSNTDTDTIEANEWAVSKLARDGTNGTSGVDGYNKATLTLYKRASSTPTRPSSDVVYTFATGSFTVPSGWSLSIPASNGDMPCYATSASAIGRDATYTIPSSAWTTPVKIMVDGEDGIGIEKAVQLRYVSSNGTNAPAKPTSEVTSTSTSVGAWTTAIPALNNTYKYMYTCEQIKWDNNTITWSDPVKDNALTDVITRIAEAELKIQDDQIVATVRNSTNYKADLASKNASFTGDGVPSNSNYPANQWTTTALKDSHLNDTFMSSSGYIYQYIKGSYGLNISFSDLSKTEANYDFVTIYYKVNDVVYVLPRLSGTAIAGTTVFVPSGTFWLHWKSDRSGNDYGFKIDYIGWAFNGTPDSTTGSLPSISVIDVSGDNYPETTHPYTANEERMWRYVSGYAENPTTGYGWAKRDSAGVKNLAERMSAAELKITDSAIVSTVSSSSFGNLVTSAIEQTAQGIYLKAKYVSWDSTNSSMTRTGVLTCTNANINGVVTTLDTSNNRLTKVQGGRIEFYRHSAADDVLTGYISPYYRPSPTTGVQHEGISLLITNNSKFFVLGTESNAFFLLNNGHYSNYYADLVFFGRCMFKNSGRASVYCGTATTPSKVNVTFTHAFNGTITPLVFITVDRSDSALNENTANVSVWVSNVSTTGFTIYSKNFGSSGGQIMVNWIAFARF